MSKLQKAARAPRGTKAAHSPAPPESGRGESTGDLADWYAAQYVAAVGLADAEGGALFRRFVGRLPVRAAGAHPLPMTGLVRMSSFLGLRLRYPLGPAGYTCLAMSATAGGASAHYAYAYWRRGEEAELPEYLCVSPTFDSRDGEYRRRFIRYPAFAGAYERLAAALAPVEEAVLRLMSSLGLRLDAAAYPEAGGRAADTAHEIRLPLMTFAVALLLDLWESTRGLLMAHTSGAYAGLMAAVAAEDPDLALGSHAELTTEELNLFRRGSLDMIAVQCGQKLVPLFLREAMQALDYNLAAWRELAVARLAGDLVLNCVSPSFPLYNQWTYVEGADSGLFENQAMADRYARGLAAGEATRSLREARRRLGEPGAPPNYYTEELGARVYEDVEYAQSYLLMSPVALAHTMEDTGWALRSLAAYVRRAPTQWPAAENAFASPASAARHLFEFAYAAHCLHSKLGVAHTDLHGNNLTFYMWGFADRQTVDGEAVTYAPYYEDPVVAYVAGPRGEADTYVFPAAGDSGCIIDYSRCILGPAFRPRLEEGRSGQYATNFYRDQVNRVMRALHRYAPAYVGRHAEALKAAVLANFDAVFPVLCAADFVAIGRSVRAALADASTPDQEEARPFRVARAGFELAGRLEREALELFVTGLHDLAEASGSRRPMSIPAFPGAALLEGVFGEWRFASWAEREPGRARSVALVDAWRHGNELRYSGADYAKWPPWARLDEIERHLGGLKVSEIFERGVEPFLEALRPGARVEVIAERLQAEQEELDGRPVSTASSWLDE
jgi:hypothetical protein